MDMKTVTQTNRHKQTLIQKPTLKGHCHKNSFNLPFQQTVKFKIINDGKKIKTRTSFEVN